MNELRSVRGIPGLQIRPIIDDRETRTSSVLDFRRSIARHLARAPLLYSRYRRTLFTAWQIPRRSPQRRLQLAWNLTSAKVCVNRSRVLRPRPSLPIVSYSMVILPRASTYIRDIYNVASTPSLSFTRRKEQGIFPRFNVTYEHCARWQPSKSLVTTCEFQAFNRLNNEVLSRETWCLWITLIFRKI